MSEIILSIAERKAHRADAHHLKPVVAIGGDGLSAAVLKEAEAALNAHGLIKVRVFSDDREERERFYAEMADKLSAARIQHIGKLLILWRPMPEKIHEADEDRMRGPRDIKILKYSRQGGQRPQARVLRVLGNERLTPGGKIRKAKPKQKSLKKRAD